ncbi:glycosyltransferase [Kocuria sp. LHG3120]|uniref:glycosyltransferase n=1 Tax=Kocuria sp. LHG3120 TaxID=2804590 RepID=UPI003CF4C53B
MNSVDTSALEQAQKKLTDRHVAEYATHLKIDPARTLCFIGGLDASKRIQFLADALELLWHRDQSIRLLVGGEGPQKKLLKLAFERGQAIDLGYLDTDQKALVMSASRAVAMPGRIGLVAVDALLGRTPIITTDWPYHAPEVEYLTEGISRFTTQDSTTEYVRGLIAATDEVPSKVPEEGAWTYPSLASMVTNYAIGVEKLLAV